MRLYRCVACFFALGLCALAVTFGCPSLRVLGLPCPGCGVTRAWLAFLGGDFRTALMYNPLFLPLTFLFLWVLINTFLERRATVIEKTVAYSIAVLACAYNILRIIYRL